MNPIVERNKKLQAFFLMIEEALVENEAVITLMTAKTSAKEYQADRN